MRSVDVSDAEEVVDTFIDLIFSPKAESAVGTGSTAFSMSDALMPGATEAMMAKTTKDTTEKAPPASDSSGSLHRPTNTGTGVHGKV